MNKYILSFFIVLLLIQKINAQGIAFETNLSWKQIKEKARKENKYIIVDAYATWCSPCKAMAKDIFTQDLAAGALNRFISVKVQMDKTNADNAEIKSWYADAKIIFNQAHITAFPTLLFYSPKGELIHKTIGYKDLPSLIAEVHNSLDSSKQYYTMLKAFKNNKLDTASVRKLAFIAKVVGEDSVANVVAKHYIKCQPSDSLFSKKLLFFLSQFITSTQDQYFSLFFKNPSKVNRVMRKNFAENLVMRLISKEYIAPFASNNAVDWNVIGKTVLKKFGPLGQEVVFGHKVAYYYDKQMWDSMSKYYKLYFDRAIGRSILHVNNMTWPIFEHSTDTSILNTAVKAMKYDIENYTTNDSAAIDTYANLLYKLGRNKEAIEWETKAVLLSNNGKEFIDTLEKMKRGEPTWRVTGKSAG